MRQPSDASPPRAMAATSSIAFFVAIAVRAPHQSPLRTTVAAAQRRVCPAIVDVGELVPFKSQSPLESTTGAWCLCTSLTSRPSAVDEREQQSTSRNQPGFSRCGPPVSPGLSPHHAPATTGTVAGAEVS